MPGPPLRRQLPSCGSRHGDPHGERSGVGRPAFRLRHERDFRRHAFLRTDFHLTDTQLEFAVGIAPVGSLVGSAIAGYSTDRWGRRFVLLGTGVGFAVFSMLSGLAFNLTSFSVARVSMLASLVTPLYLAEMSPARIRGALVSLNQLAI